MGETVGFVKLICHAESGILLGGVIVGPDASALISTLTTAVTQGLTHEQLSRVILPTPLLRKPFMRRIWGCRWECCTIRADGPWDRSFFLPGQTRQRT